MARFIVPLLITVLAYPAIAAAPESPRVYVNSIAGFGSYLATAFREQSVPFTIVMDRRQADFEITGRSESKDPDWPEVIFVRHPRTEQGASVSLINLRTTEVIYVYAYRGGQAYSGQQGAAELCAKHLKSAIAKDEVDFSRVGGHLTDGDDARPAGETTKVPPSEPGAAPALKPAQLLMSIKVESSPEDAVVEVDGYPAGSTPVDVKLTRGEYSLKVSKPGYRSSSQKIVVEAGKTQTVSISLASTERPRSGQQ